MGNHAAVKIKSRWIKSSGVQVNFENSRIRVGNRNLATTWPVIAKRLEVQGDLGAVNLTESEVSLDAKFDSVELRNWLQGHRKTSTFPKRWLLMWASLVLVGVLACMPLGERKVILKSSNHANTIDTCSTSELENWLLGKQTLDTPTLGKSTSIGGIVVGTMECKGSRYSYTLGLKEPKRVLNLKKLNS